MLLIPIIIIAIVLIIWFKQYEKSFFNKPANYPIPFLSNDEKRPIFIAFGDSLTQGNMSGNWLEKFESRNKDLACYNAGMNADLTYTLLERIDEIIEAKPQIISLLIGSNDLMATMSEARMNRYYELKKITQDADYDGFKANYVKIIEILLAETNAKILCISLPPITEDFSHKGNLLADKYSQTIKEIAEEYDLNYIPFREKLKEIMPEKSSQLDDYDQSVSLLRIAAFKKNFLGQSWDEISKSRQAMYLTDNIHLNDTASEILAEMVNVEIKKLLN
jgi:lysophospholipase L1-like esterase